MPKRMRSQSLLQHEAYQRELDEQRPPTEPDITNTGPISVQTVTLPIQMESIDTASPVSAELDEVATDTSPIPTVQHRSFARRGGKLPTVSRVDWQTVGLAASTSVLIGLIAVLVCTIIVTSNG